MGEDDGPPPDVELLDFGAKRSLGDILHVQRWPKWLPIALAGLAVAAVIAIVVTTRGPSTTPKAQPPPTSSTSSLTRATAELPDGPVATTRTVVVTRLGRSLPGEQGYALFARGAGVVVRVELGRGLVTRAAVPALASSGPVTFVAGASWSLVRPIDFVPGYLIRDGQPAREAPGTLDLGGPAYPGPDPDTAWIQTGGDRRDRMVLVRMNGRRTGVTIPVPAGSSPLAAVSDQVGFLIFSTNSGSYDVSLSGARRITTGTLRAVGPTRWLATECQGATRCRTVVIDRSGGARHTLPIRIDPADADPGVISPDGTHAALLVRSPRLAIDDVDLTTGAQHVLALPVHPTDDGGALIWSPDSRWLFTTYANGNLYAAGARSHQLINLSPAIGAGQPLNQLAIPTTP